MTIRVPRGIAQLRRRAQRGAVSWLSALDRIPPLLGASPRELATMAGLATVAGDWPTAARAARSRIDRRPDDEGARATLAVALWELGDEQAARDIVSSSGPGLSAGRARAAFRFHHHLDEPEAAESALRLTGGPPPRMAVAMADAWLRHGRPDKAIEWANLASGHRTTRARAEAVRRRSLAEQRVLDGEWPGRPAPDRRPLDPSPAGVLHLVQRSLPHHRSGSTYRTAYTVSAQSTVGLAPEVVTQPGFPESDPAATELHAGIRHHRLASTGRGPRRLDERLEEYLAAAGGVVERCRPQVLHPASDYVNALVALELRERYGLPVVYEVRGFPEELRGRWPGSRMTYEKSLGRRRLEIDCWRTADRVVTLAEVMKDHIVAHGVEPERVHVVPNAVDARAFASTPEAGAAVRARLGVGTDELLLGYHSTLAPYEGLSFLVEAVARLVAAGVEARALIVGEGKERGPLGRLAARLGVRDQVILPGRVDHAEVPDFLAAMDVFVVPRTNEVTSHLVTPLKPYEAMAAGRAVVVSRTAALAEMVLEGQTGLTFTPEDPDDLARVVMRLAADPDERQALGRRAQAWVTEHRTWEANARRYLALYRELGVVSSEPLAASRQVERGSPRISP